jgi:hypothetical protein
MDKEFPPEVSARPTADGHWKVGNGAAVLPDGRVHFSVWARESNE